MTMYDAGTPARTAEAAASSQTTPGTGHPANPPAASDLAGFLAEANKRRNRHTREEAGRPEDWADPDAAAILDVAIGHPVDRAINRHRPGRGRHEFAGAIRRACERLQGLAPQSLTADDVRAFPWHQIDVLAAAQYRELIYAMSNKQTTRNDAVCSVRSVVAQCYKAGLISALRRDLLLEELYTVAPGPSSKRRRLSQTEINDLLAACEKTGTAAATARNTAIIALFRTSGIRVGELVRIQVEDWDRDQGTIWLRETKNGDDHLVYLHPDAIPYLERWWAARGDDPGALFTSLVGETHALTPNSVRYMLRTRAAAAGVAPFGSHDFRRTFATELLRDHDVALVGKLLNHKKTTSTLIYDLASEEEQRAAVQNLDLPDIEAAS